MATEIDYTPLNDEVPAASVIRNGSSPSCCSAMLIGCCFDPSDPAQFFTFAEVVEKRRLDVSNYGDKDLFEASDGTTPGRCFSCVPQLDHHRKLFLS